MQWISVKDKLPDKDGRYLVCTDHWSNWVGVSALREGKWDDPKVSHWMPLPNPPINGVEYGYDSYDVLCGTCQLLIK